MKGAFNMKLGFMKWAWCVAYIGFQIGLERKKKRKVEDRGVSRSEENRLSLRSLTMMSCKCV